MARIKVTIEAGKVTDGEIQDGVLFKVGEQECIWPFLELERAYIENAKVRLTDVPPLQRTPLGDCQHNTQLRLDGTLIMWCAACGALYTRTRNGWAWMAPSRFVRSEWMRVEQAPFIPPSRTGNSSPTLNPDSMLGAGDQFPGTDEGAHHIAGEVKVER